MDELSNKIRNQNIQVQNLIDNEEKNLDNISLQIDQEMEKLVNNIKELKNLNPLKLKNPLINGLSFKISEFNSKIAKNEEIIKKNKDEIPDILRKKKESEEFFNKFMGEKKVWLDRLQEKKLQEIAYSKGFKYLYEAKTIKLLMEGILLHKVQDDVEKELTNKGDIFGWDIMNVERYEEKRKKDEFDLNLELVNEQNNEEALNKEREFKEKCDREEKEIKKRRQEIQQQWKDLWGEIWVPSIAYNGDDDWTTKKNLVQTIMMEVTFKLFKKLMFDVWKFKNILNNTDQYVIIEKIKKYLNEVENDFYIMGNKPNNQRKDEDAFDKMTNIIENIRREEELIYCDLKPAKKKLNAIIKSSEGVNNASAERISSLINKIESFQNNAKQSPIVLNKREVEEIHGMIKSLPDENEKKLFRDNLIDDSRLYDVFLPLTTLLMIMTFLSIGIKRKKNYEKKLEEIEEENEKLELENEEIKGKLNTLKELNSKIEEGENEDKNLIDFDNSRDSLIDITKKVTDTKNNINNQQKQLFNDIQSYLVRP
jgi:hypothetical protein